MATHESETGSVAEANTPQAMALGPEQHVVFRQALELMRPVSSYAGASIRR